MSNKYIIEIMIEKLRQITENLTLENSRVFEKMKVFYNESNSYINGNGLVELDPATLKQNGNRIEQSTSGVNYTPNDLLFLPKWWKFIGEEKHKGVDIITNINRYW